MNEAETKYELIDPALKVAGWGVVDNSRVRLEVIAPGRLQGAGKRAQQERADYVLFYKGQKLAVIEAKRRDLPDTEGVGQAKKYAKKLQTRFTYSTNGDGIYQMDMDTGEEGYVAIDKVGGAVKLVDRMEFSYNNFSSNILKGWDKSK